MSQLNKVLPIIALSMVGNLCAVSNAQMRNLEDRVDALEKKRGTNGSMVNPPARPVVRDGVNLWVQAEALAMRATEDGLQYGIKGTVVNDALVGQIKNVSYDWDWGWRVGVGYNLPHDGWDMLANYTSFRSGTKKSVKATSTEDVFQATTATYWSNNGVAVDRSTANIALNFRYLDLQMGREFFVSKWLALRPYVGARGLWNQRHMRIQYTLNGSGGFSMHEKSHLWYRAWGLLTGFDTQWSVGMGWSVYGQLALSLLFGRQGIRDVQNQFGPGTTVSPVLRVRDVWTAVRLMADLAAGIRWDKLFCNDAYRIRLQLGWEQHLLPGFSRDLYFVDDVDNNSFTTTHGDLAISGLAFQVRFDF